jgi:hypothetical protein
MVTEGHWALNGESRDQVAAVGSYEYVGLSLRVYQQTPPRPLRAANDLGQVLL